MFAELIEYAEVRCVGFVASPSYNSVPNLVEYAEKNSLSPEAVNDCIEERLFNPGSDTGFVLPSQPDDHNSAPSFTKYNFPPALHRLSSELLPKPGVISFTSLV